MSGSAVGVARATGKGWSASRLLRAIALATAAAAVIGLAGCGGGFELYGDSFSIGVSIDGQPDGGPIGSGAHRDVSIWAGESVAFDASEPVEWTLYAGDAAIPADGSTVYYGGASIRATAVGRSRIVVDTAAAGRLPEPVAITLVAVSTYDAALVATIDIYIY
ncbi:MAG: hypothetical protein LKCHEGNO_02930 [Burkholderiaceae bacterium]|nr:hypothetical protein [Burkholderiaceae bacterium]